MVIGVVMCFIVDRMMPFTKTASAAYYYSSLVSFFVLQNKSLLPVITVVGRWWLEMDIGPSASLSVMDHA